MSRKFRNQREKNRDQASRRHSVLQQRCQLGPQRLGEENALLEPDAGPERDADDGCRTIVDAILDHDPHSDDKQDRDENDRVSRDHRVRDGEHDRGNLRQEGQQAEGDPDADAHPTRRHARDLDERDA